MNKDYRQKLKHRIIKRFVAEHQRRPTSRELRVELEKQQRNHGGLDQVGFSGFDIEKPDYAEPSSSESETSSRQGLVDDLMVVNTRIDRLAAILEDNYRGFQSTAGRVGSRLDGLESRLDHLLLLNSNIDQFIYGVEETFDTQKHIDLDFTTAQVENSYCTIGRDGYNRVDSGLYKLSPSVVSQKGFVTTRTTGGISSLKEIDGSIWQYEVVTKNRQGRVSLVLDIELDEATDITDLRLVGTGVNTNKVTTVTVMYSTSGSQDMVAVDNPERAFTSEELLVNVGVEGVKHLKVILSKEAADTNTVTKGRWIYVFALDQLELLTDGYKHSGDSVLVAGPYEVVDEDESPVAFTKCFLDPCLVVPPPCSVNFFVSKDGSSWLPIGHQEDSGRVVIFEEGSATGTWELLDSSGGNQQVLDGGYKQISFDFGSEALLNRAIKPSYIDKIKPQTMVIKRDVVEAVAEEKNIYGAPRGWVLDKLDDRYSTVVYINNKEGRWIDLGGTTAFVNGNRVSGRIHLKHGYSRFATDTNDWYEVPSGLDNLSDLRAADPLYPFNHRYLIEGYSYGNGFSSQRVYTGVDEYFSYLMQYIPPEQFRSSDYAGDLGVFTIDYSEGQGIFLVKADKTSGSWKDELFEFDWPTQKGSDNQVWVKAILRTTDGGRTPIITSYKLRVI